MGKNSSSPGDYSPTGQYGQGLADFNKFVGSWDQQLGLTPPGAPDYKGAAAETASAGTQQNRPDQSNPFGSVKWSKDANGNWTQTSSLDPSLQGAASQFEAGLQGGPQARQRAEDAIYARETSRLNPRYAQQESQMKADLANQGLDPNSEAYRRAVDDFSRQKTDAYQTATNESIMGGGQEEQRNLMMNMGGLAGLRGLMQQSGFMPGTSPDYLRASEDKGKYGLDKWGMEQQAAADYMNGLGSLAGGAGSMIGGAGGFGALLHMFGL